MSTEFYLKAFGARLRQARDTAEITQTDLAERIGLTRSSISNIEAGRQAVTAHQVVRAAAALSCDPRWLLTGWDADTQSPQPQGVPRQDVRRYAALIRSLLDALEAL